jgi:cellulose synthase/poly-beta-1,6-N-acetylglucosamine synthase-like glycosyltransferase
VAGKPVSLRNAALWLFWISAFLVSYSYFLYPIILFLLYSTEQLRRDFTYLYSRRNRRATDPSLDQYPGVSFVIAALNEEKHLPDKLANIRQLDYPREKLEVIIVSDGSTDRTNQFLSDAADDQIHPILLPERNGKSNAVSVGVARSKHNILVFSDAATLFAPDAITKLVRHFSVPKIGVVCGLLRFQASTESQQTEGVYWKYETMLRLMEARLGASLTASGAIYAVRRECFCAPTSDVVIEDFVVPMRARQLGYDVHCDPEAIGIEYAPPTVSGEFTRRVRLAVGSFRAIKELIRVPLNPITTLAFASHKLLRWIVPFLLILLLLSNALLLPTRLYALTFLFQLAFYFWGYLGFQFREKMRFVRFGLLGYFWLAMNLAFLVGFWRFISGREDGVWQRVD